MVGLGSLPGGSGSVARGVSADGVVVVGTSGSDLGDQAFRWTEADGMVGLGDLPGGSFFSSAKAVSSDGLVVVGISKSALGEEAFRWTQADGMIGLGDLPGGTVYGTASDTSADGSVVVGRGRTDKGDEAFIWDQTNSMRNLREVLINDYSLDLTGWKLSAAIATSADGLNIVGYGNNPDGYQEAWIAEIPEPATLSLLALGGVAMLRRRRRSY